MLKMMLGHQTQTNKILNILTMLVVVREVLMVFLLWKAEFRQFIIMLVLKDFLQELAVLGQHKQVQNILSLQIIGLI